MAKKITRTFMLTKITASVEGVKIHEITLDGDFTERQARKKIAATPEYKAALPNDDKDVEIETEFMTELREMSVEDFIKYSTVSEA